MITIATATREPIEWTTIGDTAGTLNIITTITLIIFTIATMRDTTGATSVIDAITSDTAAGVSEFKFANKRRLRATPIQILNEHEHPLIATELAE